MLHEGRKYIHISGVIYCPYADMPCPYHHREDVGHPFPVKGGVRLLHRCFDGRSRNLGDDQYTDEVPTPP